MQSSNSFTFHPWGNSLDIWDAYLSHPSVLQTETHSDQRTALHAATTGQYPTPTTELALPHTPIYETLHPFHATVDSVTHLARPVADAISPSPAVNEVYSAFSIV